MSALLSLLLLGCRCCWFIVCDLDRLLVLVVLTAWFVGCCWCGLGLR